MKLRVKVGLIIGLIILSLVAGLYAILSRLTLSAYTRLEDRSIRLDLNRVTKALSDELNQLNSTAGDWANWNDTYTFARDHNQDYIDNNLKDVDLAMIGVNLVLILDTSGQIVFEKALDVDTSIHPLPLPHGLEAYLSAQSPLLSQLEPGQGKTGFLLLLEGPMMVSAWPILNSNLEGPSTGTLIFGRFLDAPVINRLLTDTRTSLTFTRYDANQMPGDIQAPLAALMQGQDMVVRILNMDTIAIYTLIKDINGDPAAVLRVYSDRDIYNQGKLTLNYVLLVLALVGLVFGIITMAGMEKFVLNPLARLTHEVTQIGNTQDFSGRVAVTGTDEIGELAGKTNQMLTRILESEERYRQLVTQAHEGIVSIDHQGSISFANSSMAKMLGYSIEELRGKSLLSLMDENNVSIAAQILERCGQGISERYDLTFLHKEGHPVITNLSATPIKDENGNIQGSFAIIEDTTERMQAEETLREREEHYRTLFNETLDGICLADAETGLIIDCNQALADLVGREQAELIGQPQKILHPPYDEKEIYSPTFRQHRTDKEGQILETQVVTKTGIIRTVEIKANKLNIQGRQMLQGIFRDITERVKAEEALRKQQQELQIILDSVSANIWYKDKNNKYVRVNKSVATMMNMPVEEIIGKSSYDLFPNEADKIYIDDMEVINTGQPKLGIVERLHLPGGEIKWFQTDKVPYRDEGGNITGMIIFDADITERMQAEEALRQSEERFRTLVENIPGEVYRCRPTPPWGLIHNSAKIKTISGYPASDFLNGSLLYSDFILAEDLEMVDSALEASIASKEPFIVEYRICHADGSIRWVEERGHAVYTEQGEPQWLDGVIYDITERKQAEQALLESEERYRLVTDNTADAIWLTDMNLKTTYTSPSAVKMRGFTLEELNAMTLDQHMTPASLNIILQALREELTPEKLGQPDLQISRTMELEYYRKDGSVFWSECTFTLVRDGVGNPIGILGVGRDITGRKRVEEALHESEARFRTLIEESPIAINLARSGRIIYSNPKYAQMFGYQRAEELNGRLVSDLYTPQSRKEIKEISRRRDRGEPAPNEYEVVGQHTDGTRFNVHVSVANVELADGPANIGFLTDITERKRVENLRTSLYGISELAHKVHNLDALFRSLHAIVGELLPAKNLYISLYDPITDIISFPYFVDEYDQEPPPPSKLGRGLTEYVLRTGEPLLASPEVFGELVAKREIESIGAASLDWLGVPLKTQDKVIGVLAVQSYTEGVRFNEAHKDVLLFVSSQIAMAIERVAAEQAVRINEERLRKFMDSAEEIFVLLDSKLNIVDFNLSAEKQFGFVKEKVIGRNLLELTPSIKETGQYDEFLDVIRTGKPVAYNDLLIPQMFGDRVIAMDAFAVEDGLGVIMRDITEQKMAEMRLHYAATHDSLTGLPNRALFQDRLEHAISLARRNNEKVAVMFVDLDNFKAINDTYGHATGDLLLTAIAERLVTYLRKSDTVSRLGGDEFTILVENFDSEEKLAALVEKVLEGIAKSFWIDEHEIKITASIGISYYPKDDDDSEGLLQKADAAMYRSKQSSKNSYRFYS